MTDWSVVGKRLTPGTFSIDPGKSVSGRMTGDFSLP
jgi:hypothetical protein